MIPGCPHKFVTADVWAAFRYADFARHGNLPVSGGVDDQAQIILDAMQAIWADEAHYRRDPLL